jgi:hypothetical protein
MQLENYYRGIVLKESLCELAKRELFFSLRTAIISTNNMPLRLLHSSKLDNKILNRYFKYSMLVGADFPPNEEPSVWTMLFAVVAAVAIFLSLAAVVMGSANGGKFRL